MSERVVLVHYHEIGLKGHNRGAFERRLQSNLAAAVSGLTEGDVGRIASRLLVPVSDVGRVEDVLGAVSRVPGVSYLGYAAVCERDPGAMEVVALEVMEEEIERIGPVLTFAVDARRSATQYPESSMDMDRRVGASLQAATALGVDLSNPDVTCRIEVVQANAYAYARRVEGPGGLPVGSSGPVLAMLSAGIDSPVASWRLMKRGAVVVGVHFSGRPQTDGRSVEHAIEIARVLERSGGMARLYVVDFGELQREIALSAPEDLRVLLYRRLMVRVSEALAEREGAKALVTGESLGQVASQTLENIAVVDAVARLPVFRPLIGMDKLEIVAEAKRLGTYEISTATHDDCCSLFMPRTPHTHATLAEVEAGEVDLDLDSMVARALESATHVDFACPAYRARRPFKETRKDG